MKKCAKMLQLSAVCFLLLFTSACAYYSVDDKPLAQWTPERRVKERKMAVRDRSSKLLVLVAFSGGGTRAAALAYGVLKELSDTVVMTENGALPLLKEIDVISSVSGGSFTSAYYGLYGDRIFEDFEERFLRENVQGQLVRKLFWPFNWFKLFSSVYGKGDMAAEHYDKILFDGATLGDMSRPDAPLVFINSTDLATGMRFGFIMPFFDLLCADYEQYPVARAVTASSAVPGLFSPITLENFAGSCGFEPPAWLAEAEKEEVFTTRKLLARSMREYMDREKRPWLHLVDGGVADNLGLRPFINLFAVTRDLEFSIKAMHHADLRQILIISVDAHKKPDTNWAAKRKNPSLRQVLGSVTAYQVGLYSLDTMDIVRYGFEKWTKKLSTAGHPMTFHYVDVSFSRVQNDDERSRLNEIGTSFRLKDDEVDLLISSARQVLRQSSEFQEFLAENKQRIKP